MPQFEMLEARPGVRIAVDIHRPRPLRHRPPGCLWLGGFKSEMSGTKAAYLRDMAGWGNRLFIRFDYSGHGFSEGRFEDGTISLWLEEAYLALKQAEDRPMIVIGSSMGAYLALLLAKRRISTIKGLVLVAPAIDMTEALMAPEIAANDAARTAIERDGVWMRPSRYGDPYPITRTLIEDGRKHLILPEGVDIDCPVRILHGDEDLDVPWEHGLAAYRAIRSPSIQFTLIKGGDHRLSRNEDMYSIYSTGERLAIDATVNGEIPPWGAAKPEP